MCPRSFVLELHQELKSILTKTDFGKNSLVFFFTALSENYWENIYSEKILLKKI